MRLRFAYVTTNVISCPKQQTRMHLLLVYLFYFAASRVLPCMFVYVCKTISSSSRSMDGCVHSLHLDGYPLSTFDYLG
jgi:hypothetical protein